MVVKEVGFVLVDMTIDDIEREVLRMMLIGSPSIAKNVESVMAELRELRDYAMTLPDVSFDIIDTPFADFVKPSDVNVKGFKQKRFKYRIVSAQDEVEESLGWF